MSKTLACFVTVHNPETGESVTFETGDVLPDWAEALVTNPDVFETEGGAEDSSDSTVPPSTPEAVADDPDATDDPDADTDGAGDDLGGSDAATDDDPETIYEGDDALMALTKAELLAIAEEWDCEVSDRDTKAVIAAAIRDSGYDAEES